MENGNYLKCFIKFNSGKKITPTRLDRVIKIK